MRLGMAEIEKALAGAARASLPKAGRAIAALHEGLKSDQRKWDGKARAYRQVSPVSPEIAAELPLEMIVRLEDER